MLYTKFQPSISSGSEAKLDFSGLTIFSNSSHFLFPTRLSFIVLKPCSLFMLHVKLENLGCSGFRK